ncbi:unnamed protein product, partial [Mesorhabditis belari]|uniref:Uncharacterized protein n=1 Tax=Mesorhabditis belari TaxID=2138241 RepID=A0AAF3EFB4_9BILA
MFLSTFETALFIYIAFTKSPESMRGYRIHIVDSLILFCLSVINDFRANILCFKYRFEKLVLGKLKIVYDYAVRLVSAVLFFGIHVVVYLLIYNCLVPFEQGFLMERKSLFLSVTFHPNVLRNAFSLAYSAPLIPLAILYVSAFLFYIFGTYWLLWRSKKSMIRSSRKVLLTQRTSFQMLLIQSISTLGFGLFPTAFFLLLLLTVKPIFALCCNYSFVIFGVPYGNIYPIVMLLTTRPYLEYVKRSLSKSLCSQSIHVQTVATSLVK